MSWQNIHFENFITLQRGYDLPKRKREAGNVPILGSRKIVGYHNEVKDQPPGVVTGRSGTLGHVQYTDKPYWPHNTSLWVRDFQGNDPRFVYYKLKTLRLGRFNGGASVPTLNRNVLDTVEIEIPEIDEQQKIAEVLSNYDDLIKNNKRRIELLEKSARLLYKEWFVYLRFPGQEDVPVHNGVPEGWEEMKLSELANFEMGQSPKSEFYNEEGKGLPFHQGVSTYGNRFVNNERFCSKIKKIAEPNDILISVRAPVGRLNITLDKIIIGRGLAALRSKKGHQSFLYYLLDNFFYKENLIGTGSIYASIKKSHLKELEFFIPPEHLISQFENQTIQIDKQIEVLYRQNLQLKQARDLLLPRLMNGDIPV